MYYVEMIGEILTGLELLKIQPPWVNQTDMLDGEG
jgi:hypothetical protein